MPNAVGVETLDKIQYEVHYSGRVQGVGFRYSTRQVARRHAVTGFVENLIDGRVRVVVEGDRAAVQEFLSDVDSTMAGCIREVTVKQQPVTDMFSSFAIRH